MNAWRGKTADGKFAVEFQPTVLSVLDRYCHDAGSSETGGILVGRYSDDLSLAIVREATPPPTDSQRGRSWFARGVNGLRDLLSQRWRAKERTFYVGEWHFHPADHVEPSAADFAQMRKISNAREYDCREPLLLIFGAGRCEEQRIFRAFVCSGDDKPMEFLREKEV